MTKIPKTANSSRLPSESTARLREWTRISLAYLPPLRFKALT